MLANGRIGSPYLLCQTAKPRRESRATVISTRSAMAQPSGDQHSSSIRYPARSLLGIVGRLVVARGHVACKVNDRTYSLTRKSSLCLVISLNIASDRNAAEVRNLSKRSGFVVRRRSGKPLLSFCCASGEGQDIFVGSHVAKCWRNEAIAASY